MSEQSVSIRLKIKEDGIKMEYRTCYDTVNSHYIGASFAYAINNVGWRRQYEVMAQAITELCDAIEVSPDGPEEEALLEAARNLVSRWEEEDRGFDARLRAIEDGEQA